ncbi:MAG: methyltransferase [Planctomycetota bacterium]|jgi:precorrin-6B methylase 2
MAKQWTFDDIMCMGWSFQSACILTAAAEFDLFTALVEREMNAEAIAGRIGCDLRGATILLDALVSLELLSKKAGDYSLSTENAELLSESSPNNVLPMLRHLGVCLRRWAQLGKVVKSGESAERIPGVLDKAAETEAFIAAMNNLSAPVAAEVVGRLQPLEFDHLLDIGGASGTWTIEFLKAAPGTKATIFDLPDVIPMARERIASAGLDERVDFVAGDFYEDDLPSGADLAWFGAIAHQNSRQQNRELFAKTSAALQDGGTVVIRDVVMDASHTAPRQGALFAVNMLVGTLAGGTYSLREYTEDLEASGFTDVTLVHREEFMNSLIRAKKK